jgi:hypothetical protein
MSTIHIVALAVVMYLATVLGTTQLNGVYLFMVGMFVLNLATGKHVPK